MNALEVEALFAAAVDVVAWGKVIFARAKLRKKCDPGKNPKLSDTKT